MLTLEARSRVGTAGKLASYSAMTTDIDAMAEEYAAFDRQVGARIKRRRRELRMSQKDFAARLGVSYQQVQKYEAGKSRLLASRLYFISRVLGTSLPALIGMTDADEKVTATRSELARLNEAWNRLPPGPARQQLLRYIETLCRDIPEDPAGESKPWIASTS